MQKSFKYFRQRSEATATVLGLKPHRPVLTQPQVLTLLTTLLNDAKTDYYTCKLLKGSAPLDSLSFHIKSYWSTSFPESRKHVPLCKEKATRGPSIAASGACASHSGSGKTRSS